MNATRIDDTVCLEKGQFYRDGVYQEGGQAPKESQAVPRSIESSGSSIHSEMTIHLKENPLFSSYYYTVSQRELLLCSPFMPHATKWIDIDEKLPCSSTVYRTSVVKSVPSSPRIPPPPPPLSCGYADEIVSSRLGSLQSNTGFARDSSRGYYESMPCSPTSEEAASYLLSLKGSNCTRKDLGILSSTDYQCQKTH